MNILKAGTVLRSHLVDNIATLARDIAVHDNLGPADFVFSGSHPATDYINVPLRASVKVAFGMNATEPWSWQGAGVYALRMDGAPVRVGSAWIRNADHYRRRMYDLWWALLRTIDMYPAYSLKRTDWRFFDVVPGLYRHAEACEKPDAVVKCDCEWRAVIQPAELLAAFEDGWLLPPEPVAKWE